MPVQKTDKIWHNGKWILWDDAKLHVLYARCRLRLGRFRRHSLLRHPARPGDLPAA